MPKVHVLQDITMYYACASVLCVPICISNSVEALILYYLGCQDPTS